jgi:acid stress chaperone HdeA
MKALAAAAVVTTALVLNGCSVSQVINTGGDTKCKDFLTQDEKHQTDEVTKMIRDRRLNERNTADPTPAQVSATRGAAVTYCQTVGQPDPDSKIAEAPAPQS